MHPQTRKNRSKKNLKIQLQDLRDRIATLEGEMLLLQTLMGMADQFSKANGRLAVKIKVPPGWKRGYDWVRRDGSDVILEFDRERKEGDET